MAAARREEKPDRGRGERHPEQDERRSRVARIDAKVGGRPDAEQLRRIERADEIPELIVVSERRPVVFPEEAGCRSKCGECQDSGGHTGHRGAPRLRPRTREQRDERG
jgi:hypothetical protein